MENGNNALQRDPRPIDLADRLRAGERVSDTQFDQLFSEETRAVSFRHWTPVSVASRAASLLAEAGAKEVLDVGSGPGKLCIVGALRTNARFTGVEQRRRLIEEARVAAVALGADRARFVHANFVDFDCTPFDGFYFYNPFQEQLEEDDPWPIDDTVQRSPVLHRTYVAVVAAALMRAPVGTLVATFHGLGAPMPKQYRRLHGEPTCGSELALWIRVSPSQDRAYAPRRVPERDLGIAPHTLATSGCDRGVTGSGVSFVSRVASRALGGDDERNEKMLDELRSEAARLDRSVSWVVQQTWRAARKQIMTMPSATYVPVTGTTAGHDDPVPDGSAE